MKNTTKRMLIEICNATLLAGLIILVISVYYIIGRIPYQDPTVEMQIRYAVNYEIGDVLSKLGLALALLGGIVRLAVWRLCCDDGRTAQ